MRDGIYTASDHYAVGRLVQAQYLIPQPQGKQNPKSTAPKLGSVPAIPDSPRYEAQLPTGPSSNHSTRFANGPRYAVPTTQIPFRLNPSIVTRIEQASTDMFSSHPGSPDSFRLLNPIRDNFQEQLLKQSNNPYGSNLSRSFQHSDLGPKQDKDVAIGEPSPRRQKRPQYFQLYRFEKVGQDWTVADKIRINVPQDELKQIVDRRKSRTPVVDMTNMHPIRREQINRLLDEKNNKRDKDAKWAPVLIQKKRWSGRNLLAMDVIIAKTFIPGEPLPLDDRVSFAGEKSDLRAPTKSTRKPMNRERLATDQDSVNEEVFFGNDGRPIDVTGQPQEFTPRTSPPEGWNGPLPNHLDHHSPPIKIADRNYQRYTSQSNSDILHLNQPPPRTSVDNNNHIEDSNEPRLTDFRRTETADFQRVGAASKNSSGKQSPGRHSSNSGPKHHSRRYLYEDSGSDNEDKVGSIAFYSNNSEDIVGSVFSDGNDRCSASSYHYELEPYLQRGSLTQRHSPRRDEKPPEEPHQGSNDPFPNPFVRISALHPQRCQQRNSPSNLVYHISSASGDRNPTGDNPCDHMDLGRPIGMSFIVPPIRPDSAYYTASDQMSSRCDPFSRPASRKRASSFSLRLGSPIDRYTRATESNTAQRDHIHSGEQQHKSDFAISKELGDDVKKDCEPENRNCARLEATFSPPPRDQCSSSAEIQAIKKLKTTNTRSPLITPADVATAAVTLPQVSLSLRPKLEFNGSFPCLPPCNEEDYTIAASELSRISDELTKYFTYYCSVTGCIHSAGPELCNLDSRNAKTIHDSEAHKVYVLDGLSEVDLKAHIFEAHNVAISDSRHLEDISAYKHTPLVAEERRFTVASATNPDASGWLMRARIAGQPWSDWKGLDYNLIAANGFRPWDCKDCLRKSQPRPSNSYLDTATDESIDCALKSNAPVDVMYREAEGDLEGSAELPVNFSASEMWQTVDPIEAIAIHGRLGSVKQPNSNNDAKSQPNPDGRPPASMSLMSSEVDHGSSTCTGGPAQSSSDGGSLSSRRTNSDDDIDSDVSITVHTKRRVLENVMNEAKTLLFDNFSSTPRCQSEGSESTSSSEVAKPSRSFEQTSQTRSSNNAGKKRAQGRDPFSEDEDDGNQKRHKKSISASFMTAGVRRLACPFNKHNPKVYSACNEDQDLAQKFRPCGGPGWPTVHRLKEHLYRVHPTPIQCKRCWLTMKTEKELEEHVRAQEPCSIQPQLVQWVPRDKVEALKDRKKARQSQNEEERWNYVYGLLFPEDLSLPSPYYDDSEDRPQDDRPKSPSSRNFAAFEKFSQENLPRRIREAVEAVLDERVLPIEESLKTAIPEIVRSCQAQIFRDWEEFSSKGGPRTAQNTLHGTIEADETAIPGHYDAQPPPGNESLSTFFVEPGPAVIANAFDVLAHFDDHGEGPSRTIADSGYHSLRRQSDLLRRELPLTPDPMTAADITNMCSLEDDLEDPSGTSLDDPTDFDWSEYLAGTGSSPTGPESLPGNKQ